MSELAQRNGGSNWSSWVLGIVSGLILVAIVGSIIFERDVARTLGEHEVQIKNLTIRIDERTLSRFTRDDFEREIRNRDRRLELLEQRGSK